MKRSDSFIAKRQRSLKEAAEDYTELIEDFIQNKGEARVCDLAKEMGISHVTVIRTLARLEAEGYLKTSPRNPIDLTQKGRKLAKSSKQKHEILYSFLLKIGVSKQNAQNDVEGIEHHISDETLSKITDLLKNL